MKRPVRVIGELNTFTQTQTGMTPSWELVNIYSFVCWVPHFHICNYNKSHVNIVRAKENVTRGLFCRFRIALARVVFWHSLSKMLYWTGEKCWAHWPSGKTSPPEKWETVAVLLQCLVLNRPKSRKYSLIPVLIVPLLRDSSFQSFIVWLRFPICLSLRLIIFLRTSLSLFEKLKRALRI